MKRFFPARPTKLVCPRCFIDIVKGPHQPDCQVGEAAEFMAEQKLEFVHSVLFTTSEVVFIDQESRLLKGNS